MSAEMENAKERVVEAAFDFVYGFYDREFRKLNGGMKALFMELKVAVDRWSDCHDDEEG